MKSSSINVLLLTGCYLPGYKGGGPIKTVSNLVNATSDVMQYSIVTSDRDLGDKRPYSSVNIGQWNQRENNFVYYTGSGPRGLIQIAKIILKRDYQIIYLNSFFSTRFSIIPLFLAKIIGKRVILAPRGEFSEGALSLKHFKKKVYMSIFKLFKLHHNIIFQVSSQFESNDTKKALGVNANTFIAENIGSQKYANSIVRRNSSELNIVFLSRISPMKNLNYALKILSKVTSFVTFDIYGPLEDQSYWKECQNIISKIPKNIKVNYKGTLDPNLVVDTLSKYDLFFMPTQGENYGHVIAEALCAGLPILIANTTPWTDLNQKGIGWDISLNESEQFIDVIHNISNMPAEEHYELRKHVLSWAENKFSQRDNIKQNIAMFRYAFENK